MALRPLYKEGDPVRWFRGKIQELEDHQEKVAREAVEYGAELMREFINTRGTGRTWERPWGGRDGSYPGRVNSETMLNAVTTRVVKDSAGRTQAHFGWLTVREDYFRYQEGGFKHNIKPNHNVKGMYALVDAAEAAFEYLKERLSEG